MKVAPPPAPSAAARPQTSFRQLVVQARGPTATGQPGGRPLQGTRATPHRGTAGPCAAQATAAQLGRARAHANAEAQRLQARREASTEAARTTSSAQREAEVHVRDAALERLLDCIARELPPEERRPPYGPGHPLAQVEHLAPPVPGAAAPSSRLRAAQAAALVERIEVFVRSQGRGLALTLHESLGARIELARVGPRALAVKLVGRGGPPSAEVVSRIREALRARGLEVRALEVA